MKRWFTRELAEDLAYWAITLPLLGIAGWALWQLLIRIP